VIFQIVNRYTQPFDYLTHLYRLHASQLRCSQEKGAGGERVALTPRSLFLMHQARLRNRMSAFDAGAAGWLPFPDAPGSPAKSYERV